MFFPLFSQLINASPFENVFISIRNNKAYNKTHNNNHYHKMSNLVNKQFPSGDFKFQYIAISQSDADSESCKMPQTVEWSKLISENKKVIITGAPAAFSPTCTVSHIPGYINYLDELVKEKEVDQVIVVTVDNPFANQAWAKSLGVKDTTHIKFASDPGCAFTKSIGFELGRR